MNKIISIISGAILTAGIIVGTLGYFNQTVYSQPVRVCGDGVCDAFEQSNLDLCPQDCKEPGSGFLGCSITHNAITGYEYLGGSNFWSVDEDIGTFGGGCLSTWHYQLENGPGPKDFWGIFENYLTENPEIKKIWWELCSCPDVADLTYEQALMVLDEIKRMAAGIEIYATPMPLFPDSTDKFCMENHTPAVIRNYVNRMVAQGRVNAGPILSPLRKWQTNPDGCHANEQGRLIWGQNLIDFFDNVQTQLPINIVYVNHVEVESVLDFTPPLQDGRIYKTIPEKYARTKEQIEWEIAQAEAVGGYISFHMSGAYAERAISAEDIGRWESFVGRGHTVGVHTHEFLRGPNTSEWIFRTSPTQAEIYRHWHDNYDLVADLIGAEQLWIGESHYSCAKCWEYLGYRLKTTEAMVKIPDDAEQPHIVWLVERNNKGTITYPHFPQIGQAGYHGPLDNRIYFDLRLPQLKKEFLMLYLEWLERERLGLAPQVWTWGWANHAGESTKKYAEDIQKMLVWLDNEFAGKTSMRGNNIAGFVSDHELSDIYEKYEESGGKPLPSPLSNVNDQFPYMASALKDAGVTANLSNLLGLEGVRLFELERQPPDGPVSASYQKVYLLFRENDDRGVVDISGLLNATFLTMINVIDGTESWVNPDNLYLGFMPLVLEIPV